MKIFLKDIASGLLNDYGSKLAGHCIVFPNNRSILFFRKYLSELIDKPLFMPSLQTISSLIAGQSRLRQAETVHMVLELYNVYIRAGNRKETIDEFYFWGEMLLNDFDDIDKYLVDPALLFSNLADLKEIDQKFSMLSEEMAAIIKQFWVNFDASNMTGEKADFLSVWETLPSVYSGFREVLRAKGLGYEGMIIREQAEQISSAPERWDPDTDMFHFVGFNALNKCEGLILKELHKAGRARFYWDYDERYVNNTEHEAGHFIRQNMSVFPADSGSERNPLPACRINVYSAPSDVAQAKLIPSLLKNIELSEDPNDTAVILADENLLAPVLNSLPESIADINVTMGYPLFQTAVYSLVHQLLQLQKNKQAGDSASEFYYNDVINILQHQYIAFNYPSDSRELIKNIKKKNIIRISSSSLELNELFGRIFGREFNNRTYLADILRFIIDLLDNDDEGKEEGRSSRLNLQQEYLYSLLLPINQLALTLEESQMDPGIELYSRLIDKMMRKLVIPFSGEPLQGVQVMGILETRSLDFKNIIFLSANEGKIPRSPAGNSYIPYNLREAFGLPTVKHSDSIYAYYFYRLLHRAEQVNFVYNNSTDGMRSGEMSRFLLQLKYDRQYNTSFFDTGFNILPPAKVKHSIKRTDKITDVLESSFLDGSLSKPLSPSAINTWITCNMRFYYRYIAGIREPEQMLEEVDSLAFGNILHHVMKELFEPYTGKQLTGSELEKMQANREYIAALTEKSFRKVFMKGNRGAVRGKNMIITSIIEKMAGQVIQSDLKYSPVKIISLEDKYPGFVSCTVNGTGKETKLEGTIDRVDLTGGVYRILDYKSGADGIDVNTLDQLFDYESGSRNSAAFQTLLYCELFLQNNPGVNLRPSLYPVRSIFSDKFSDIFNIKKGEDRGPVQSYSTIRDSFMTGLSKVISDIFDKERDIVMTSDLQKCRYCPYNRLCDRKS